jgi:hypothetical protein
MQTPEQLSKEEWKKIDKALDFIYLNTDRCCQDLCEGQLCKFEVEEVMNILSKIRPNV